MSVPQDPRGNLLAVSRHLDGYSRVKLDNGPASVINLLVPTELVDDLLSTDLRQVWEHVMTRKPGHFRKKEGR